ncbi:acyltransferase family protein [Sphingopyxis sp. NFH-91]|uniref:acyltransferase family protein n=1 Tax=Sphingopyxis sp. NFH-91 TaxID=2744457 RepID=UPI001F1AF613|nr:acyltransferase [Sphingopyxis sp. NFH-91]
MNGAQHKRIGYLDGWRGLAILFVLLGHFGSAVAPALEKMGGFGVEFFFVLSGRLMAEILFVQRMPLPTFFFRRFSRIFPALLVFVAAMCAVGVLLWMARGRTTVEPWMAASALTFTINYAQALGQTDASVLTHVWSLSVEEHCYILLALIGVALARKPASARVVIAAIGFLALANGLRLVVQGGGVHEVYWRTDVRLAPVFLSAALYLTIGVSADVPARVASILGWLPLPCVGLTIVLFYLTPIEVHYTASAILLAVAVVTLDYAPMSLRKFLSMRAFTTFGMLSYSIYLWQQPFYLVQAGASFWFAMLPAAMVAGAFSYLIVERPSRHWLNSWFAQRLATIKTESRMPSPR